MDYGALFMEYGVWIMEYVALDSFPHPIYYYYVNRTIYYMLHNT